MNTDLDTALHVAHATNDYRQMITLYVRAAQTHDGQAAAFYLTHAYIYALELGDPRAPKLHAQLIAMNAEC